MDAVKYFEEKRRMLDSLGRTKQRCDNVNCLDCPLYFKNNGIELYCGELEILYPERAIDIIEKWSQEHPRKTFLSDFLEKYPNAKLLKNGTPKNICPEDLGYCDKVDECKPFTDDCAVCWNRPLEE